MWGEVQIYQRRRIVQGESRERDSASTETFAVYPYSGGVPRAQHPEEWTGFVSGVLWEERGWEKNGV
jgi:hypothetical protein